MKWAAMLPGTTQQLNRPVRTRGKPKRTQRRRPGRQRDGKAAQGGGGLTPADGGEHGLVFIVGTPRQHLTDTPHNHRTLMRRRLTEQACGFCGWCIPLPAPEGCGAHANGARQHKHKRLDDLPPDARAYSERERPGARGGAAQLPGLRLDGLEVCGGLGRGSGAARPGGGGAGG